MIIKKIYGITQKFIYANLFIIVYIHLYNIMNQNYILLTLEHFKSISKSIERLNINCYRLVLNQKFFVSARSTLNVERSMYLIEFNIEKSFL